MGTWPKELLDLFDDPLLEGVRPKPAAVTADERTMGKIESVKKWIESNGREPQQDSRNITEKLMWKSLETLKKNGLWI